MSHVSKIKDISNGEVTKFIENLMISSKKTKKEILPLVEKINQDDLSLYKSIQKIKKENKENKQTFKNNLKKSLTNNLSLIKSLKRKLNDPKNTLINKRKIKGQLSLNKEHIRNLEINVLQKKYSQKKQNCEERKFYNCQKGYNSCRIRLGDLKCHFDPQLQQELIKSIVDQCQQGCVCNRKRPYKNYYRGRNYCSEQPEKVTLLESLASITRFDLMPLGISTIYSWTLQTVLDLNIRINSHLYLFLFIKSSLIPNFFNVIRASQNVMYEIDNQGFKKIFKKYLKMIGISSILMIPAFILSVFNTILCYTVINKYNFEGFLFNFIPEERYVAENLNINNEKKISKWIINNVDRLHAPLAGAAEEILFRETLPKLIERIKPYLYKYYEKEFKSNEDKELDYQVHNVYIIISTAISGIYFGLIHIDNGRLMPVICQVINCMVIGVLFSCLKRRVGLLSCWLSHFFHNYLDF